MAAMSEGDLAAILNTKITGSITYLGGKLASDRVKADKYYNGERFGNELEGRSQVVSRDVQEAVDGMMPSLIKIFSSGDEVVHYEPRYRAPKPGEDPAAVFKKIEDEAKQATDYVNWIWGQQNPGFATFHTWFKDALLKKVGVVKIWWDTNESITKESYDKLSDDEYQALLTDPELTLKEHTEYPDPDQESAAPLPAAPPGAGAAPPAAPPPVNSPPPVAGMPGNQAFAPPILQPQILHDCVFRRNRKDGRVTIVPVPPDEFLIDRRAVDLDEVPFTAHRRKWTMSDLMQEYPGKKEVIKNLPADGDGLDLTAERTERFQAEDDLPFRGVSSLDPSQREIWVTEGYLKVDFDGDGIAELRKVSVAGGGDGGGNVILDNEEVDDNPFASVTPIPMSHKFFGQSIYDRVEDLQLIKSVLWRGALDSVYLSIAPMVTAKGKVDMDSLLNRRPGGVVRLGADGEVEPLPTESVAQQAFEMMTYVDTVRDERTGVRRFATGPGADALNNAYTQTATGVNAQADSSAERLELIARVFAETGVKRAFRRILELICKHQDKPKVIRLRGKWVEMDPREWDDEMDLTVSVGLGTGNKQQQIGTITNLLNIDKEIVTLQGGLHGPLVTAQNLYAKLAKLVEASGLKSVESYYTDPATAPPAPPPPPDPKMQAIQLQAQMDSQQQQQDMQIAQQKAAQERADQQHEMMVRDQEMRMQAGLKQQQAQQEMALERARFDMQMAHDRMEAGLKLHIAELTARQSAQHADEANAAKVDAMKEMAKAKPKPQAEA